MHSIHSASVTFEGSPRRLGCVCLSHPLPLDASHLGFSRDHHCDGKGPQEPHKSCQSSLQPWPCSASAEWLLSNACLFTELEERWYWSHNSFGGVLVATEQVKLAKVRGCPHHHSLNPEAELGDSFPLIYWAIIVCLLSLKTAPLVSCPNHDVAHLHLLVDL